MLEVSLARLRALWPAAGITVFTADRARLERMFPGLLSIPTSTRTLYFRQSESGAEDPDSRGTLAAFRGRLSQLDLFLVSGMGSYHDAGGQDAIDMLDTIRLVRSLGVPAVAFSQGIGPIRKESAVWAAARRALPCLDFIALREGRSGPELLRELGVPSDKIVVTGDDAVEPAYRTRSAGESVLLGVNLRATSYAGITAEQTGEFAAVVQAAARQLSASIVPAPTSFVPWESDLDAFARMFPGESVPTDVEPTPEWAIGRIGRCRLIITGSYHGAVFALSQGIPAVCIENSEYYRDKFLGLAGQFGEGCTVIRLSDPGFEERVLAEAMRLWRTAEDYSKPLRRAAARQVEKSKAAWLELPSRVPALSR